MLCGLPVQHDHYVPTKSGMLNIYRGSSSGGGHRWEDDERPFPFGPEHDWLKDAVVLPWDQEKVLRGAIEDGIIETPDGDSCMVWDGSDEGLAYHHACWTLQGSPASTGPAFRADQSHGWALLRSYHEQLFEFAELAADGKAWMLKDPTTDDRSRGRIEAILGVVRHEVKEAPRTIPEVLAADRDWSCRAVRHDNHDRKSLVRARMYAIQKVPKDDYVSLLRITRPIQVLNDLETWELGLKATVEKDALAILAVVGINKDRAVYLVYSRDAAKTKSLVQDAQVETAIDYTWSEVTELIRSLR